MLIFVCLFVRFTLVCQLAVIHMSFIQLRLVFFLIIFQISSCRTFFPFLKGPQSFFCKTVCSHQSMILRTQNNLEIKIHHSTIFFVIILGHFTSFFQQDSFGWGKENMIDRDRRVVCYLSLPYLIHFRRCIQVLVFHLTPVCLDLEADP